MLFKNKTNTLKGKKKKKSKASSLVKNFLGFFSLYGDSKKQIQLYAFFVALAICLVLLILGTIFASLGKTSSGLALLLIGMAFAVALALFTIYSIGKSQVREAAFFKASDEELNSFEAGESISSEATWSEPRYQAAQSKMNSFLSFCHRAIEKSQSEKPKSSPYPEFLTKKSFAEALNEEIESNPSYLSALLILELSGKEEPTPEAKEALIREAKAQFPNDLIGDNSPASIALYVYSVPSKFAFEEKLSHFVSQFTYCYNDPAKSRMDVFGVRIGGAFFPNHPKNSLYSAASNALSRSQGVDIDHGEGYGEERKTNPHIPMIGKRVESLYASSCLAKPLSASSEKAISQSYLLRLFAFYLAESGFEAGGLYVYDSRTSSYRLFASTSLTDFKGLAKLGDKVEGNVLDPYYDLSEEDDPFYTKDPLILPHDLSLSAQGLDITSAYLSPIRFEGKKKGLLYLASPKEVSLTLRAREELYTFSSIVSAYLLGTLEADAESFRLQVLNSLSSRKEIYVYTIERESHRLVFFTDNFSRKFKNARLGQKCHKALFGLDEPCPNCPLTGGTAKRMISSFGPKEITHSVLGYRVGSEGFTSMMMEREEEKAASSSLMDKSLQIKNAKAFQMEANREMRNALSRGTFLAIRLANRAELLSRFPEQNSNSLLSVISRELGSIGYDDMLYRLDSDTLVIRFPGNATRSALFVSIEGIAEQLEGPLYCGSDAFSPKLTYSMISYPTDVNNVNDLLSLFQTELTRSAKMGEGYVSEVGRAKGRKASRDAYVGSLIESKLRTGRSDLLFQPIESTSTKSIRIVSADCSLIAEDRTRIYKQEFGRIAAKKNLIPALDYASMRALGEFYIANRDSFFSANGIQGVIYHIEDATFSDKDFIPKVVEIKSSYQFQDDYLVLSLSASYIAKNVELVRRRLGDLREARVLVFASSYRPSLDSPHHYSELGIDGVLLSDEFLKSALANESERLSYGSSIRDIKSAHLVAVSTGVEDNEAYQFIQGLGVPYMSASEGKNSVNGDELISNANYKR